MSGFEVAGVVLASVGLLVQGLQSNSSAISLLLRGSRYNEDHRKAHLNHLEAQQSRFESSLMEVLLAHVGREQCDAIILNPLDASQAWKLLQAKAESHAPKETKEVQTFLLLMKLATQDLAGYLRIDISAAQGLPAVPTQKMSRYRRLIFATQQKEIARAFSQLRDHRIDACNALDKVASKLHGGKVTHGKFDVQIVKELQNNMSLLVAAGKDLHNKSARHTLHLKLGYQLGSVVGGSPPTQSPPVLVEHNVDLMWSSADFGVRMLDPRQPQNPSVKGGCPHQRYNASMINMELRTDAHWRYQGMQCKKSGQEYPAHLVITSDRHQRMELFTALENQVMTKSELYRLSLEIATTVLLTGSSPLVCHPWSHADVFFLIDSASQSNAIGPSFLSGASSPAATPDLPMQGLDHGGNRVDRNRACTRMGVLLALILSSDSNQRLSMQPPRLTLESQVGRVGTWLSQQRGLPRAARCIISECLQMNFYTSLASNDLVEKYIEYILEPLRNLQQKQADLYD